MQHTNSEEIAMEISATPEALSVGDGENSNENGAVKIAIAKMLTAFLH